MVTLEKVREAAVRLEGVAHHTPVMTSEAIDDLAGRQLIFKCENLQKVGAFKFRGAWNAVASLSDGEAERGVCTHSSGNHAQALALAAQMRGIAAHIVMPDNAAPIKLNAVEGYGAAITLCEPTLKAREATLAELQNESGAVLVHSYDDARIIAGQGTAALELLAQAELDAIITPIGGGGLLSGTCIATQGTAPEVALYGAEPAGADDAAQSLASGELVPQLAPDTICDGLLSSLGKLTWPILRDNLAAIITVDDDAVRQAMRLLWEQLELLVEPSGAIGLAAALSPDFQSDAQRVGIILTGGNVDPAKFFQQ
ncbi:MAG: pyridoxal-phosphate dependent enzyme [Candidatus Poseidoniia archaeon]|jgi:threonine dehydratase|nr:pyridoxal-phosphate dependent enzyme [Candidatus Poseidoniia archaeon]MDP6534285.1 pyridoxal-phosphate dependent enzyme [Candidatus Poseidoniia archaeon]MDP6834599.1 pyridoxal-phosphate dependent enzyme [Candidatus Poseidoniia archaeon]HIH78990.1 pyridoxal-phosphate dependent enzyme [Candidatus Poseidoniia archaeon]